MANLYGYKFASQFGETPHEDWVHVLTGITGRQMADGLNKCLTDYPEWPPGAAQFRALCLGLNPRNVGPEGDDASWALSSPSYMAFDDPRRPENNPDHPNYVPKQAALVDLTARDENRKKGKNALSGLKNMFRQTQEEIDMEQSA